MTTYEILEDLKTIIPILEKYNYLSAFVSELSSHYKVIEKIIAETPSVSEATFTVTIRGELEKITKFIHAERAGLIFIEINKVLLTIKSKSEPNEDKLQSSQTPFTPLVESLQEFYDFYENNLGRFKQSSSYKLMRIANDIKQKLSAIDDFVAGFINFFANESEIKEGNKELSLYFSTTLKYNEVIEKLSSIQGLYNEFSRLLNVSVSEYPLEIAKLEIGSWWIKIFGESKVIALITTLTEKSVSYLHRNYTTEGKINTISNKVEAVEELLSLSKLLKENGIDTKTLDNNIKHSSVLVAKLLNTLLVGEPNVKVNDKKFYIGEKLDDKLLQERKTLQLSAGTSEEISEPEIVE